VIPGGPDMVAQRELIREWREQYARRWLNIDFEPMPDTPVRVPRVIPIFEDLRIVRAAFSPGFTFRDRELVKDGDDSFVVIISQSRTIDIKQHRAHDLRLGYGDATVLHVGATGRVGSPRGIERIGVAIPRSEFTARSAHPDDAVMQLVRRRSEGLKLLCGYIGSLEKNRLGAWREGRETIRQQIIDLAVLAITAHAGIGESGLSAVAAARLDAALDYIAAHFEEPELSVAMVASSQGISPRYLQRLIEASGTSFTARVNDLRLQKALTLLSEARDSGRRISDIAFDVGFSDLSHFNRLFRSRFGDTPRGVREQRLVTH
jgi:AraC-like DNA-binding protein